MSRTKIDWTKHKLEVVENEHIVIHDLRILGSSVDRVTFHNIPTAGLLVSGDHGCWTFSLPFLPGPYRNVDEEHWFERLQESNSCVDFRVFCRDRYRQSIKRYTKMLLRSRREGFFDAGSARSAFDFYTELFDYCDEWDEWDATQYMREEMPESIETEYLPQMYHPPRELDAIFDAWEEVCRRLGK